MRQVFVQAARGQGHRVLSIAHAHQGMNLACMPADAPEGPVDVVLVHLSNEKVEAFLGDLQEKLPEAKLTLPPQGVIALAPPPQDAPDQTLYVSHRSPVGVFLSGLQSVGSWTGFLGYAAAAGVVVWIGLYTNTIFLLVAAMLIAPYAGPAMNMALATARGDGWLLGRTVLRYFASLAVTILVAALLSWLLGQQQATQLMVDNSLIPSIALLLPLTAGAAGALNLCQSERSSLVSGAATGVLVAASLAPPAGLLGMTVAIGRWDMVQGAAFLLLLQLVGINLAGAVVFRLFGLSPRGARYDRGRGWLSWTTWLVTGVALAGLVAWQFTDAPNLQRSSRQQRAEALVRDAVNGSGIARLVDASVRFTRPDIPGQETLLAVVYVQQLAEAESDGQIERQLLRAIRSSLQAKEGGATPLVDVTVLEE
jgi:uncharacterized hydrophobic protein (TIGR00271 family)